MIISLKNAKGPVNVPSNVNKKLRQILKIKNVILE